jgi:AraC-like DNA-binding protein
MTRRQAGFTRASSLGHISDFVAAHGGSIDRVFSRSDLPVALLERPEILIPLKDQFRLLEQGAKITGDPLFGARLGKDVRVRNLSTFGHLVSKCDTLRDAIAFAAANVHVMLQSATLLHLHIQGRTARWSVELLDPASDGRGQHELLALWYMIDAVREFAGHDWKPSMVTTTTPRGTAKSATELIYGTNVSTGHPLPAICFDAGLLSLTSPKHRTPSKAPPRPHGTPEPPLPAEGNFPGLVSVVSELALQQGMPRIEWVAARLGMTQRTLQRRLNQSGISFKHVLEGTLHARACALIGHPALPITEVALRLGYNDPSHFSRAFKRWTGASPSDYRRARERPAQTQKDPAFR